MAETDPRFVVAEADGKVGVYDTKRKMFAPFEWAPHDALPSGVPLSREDAVIRAVRTAQWMNDGSMTPTGFVWTPRAADAVRPLDASELPPPPVPRLGTGKGGSEPYSPARWESWGEHDDRL